MELETIDSEVFARLDYMVMAEAFGCQNQIGRLADEEIYQAARSEDN